MISTAIKAVKGLPPVAKWVLGTAVLGVYVGSLAKAVVTDARAKGQVPRNAGLYVSFEPDPLAGDSSALASTSRPSPAAR